MLRVTRTTALLGLPAVWVLALAVALTGCDAGSGEDGRPPGSPAPGGGSVSPRPPVASARPRPQATRVTPSISLTAYPCPTPTHTSLPCVRARAVEPVIDPTAPCVEGDLGRNRGASYVCMAGTWIKLRMMTGR